MKNLTKLILSAWGLAGLQAYANLVQNPGFETGDFTGWTVSGDISAFAGSAHSGTYSAAFDDAISQGSLTKTSRPPQVMCMTSVFGCLVILKGA